MPRAAEYYPVTAKDFVPSVLAEWSAFHKGGPLGLATQGPYYLTVLVIPPYSSRLLTQQPASPDLQVAINKGITGLSLQLLTGY